MDNKEKAFSEWLVLRCQQGQRQALKPLLEMWQARYLAYIQQRLGDPDSARDVLQEALLAICRNLYKLQDPASFPRWSFTIVERRCLDQLRRRYRHRQVFADSNSEVEQSAPHNPEAALDSSRLLARLPGELASLLRLYYLEGLSLPEIAGIQNIPRGTVKSRLFYARKKLQKLLEEEDERTR
jgi:RNA polymerase sigma-70 factor (ECF subfamily)